MKQAKGFLLGVGCTLLALALTVGVLAANGVRIEVDPSIRIKVNGETFRPTDVNGKAVMTFAYEGTTYAPLRALAEAYGLEVGYDPEAKMATVNRPSAEPEAAQTAAEAFAGILDVGDRLTTFVSRTDGSVYCCNEDLGPWVFSRPEEALEGDPSRFYHAFDKTVKQFEIGQWAGFALDTEGVLWAWGGGPEGEAGTGFPEPEGVTRLLENIADVEEGMALGEDGTLWVWGSSWSAVPRKAAENVRQIADGLFLQEDGSVWMVSTAVGAPEPLPDDCIVLPPAGGEVNGSGYELNSTLLLQKIADDGERVEGGLYLTADNSLRRPWRNPVTGQWTSKPVMERVKQAVWDYNREFALGEDGRLWEVSGKKPEPAAEHVREVFPCGPNVAWTDETGDLWMLPAEEKTAFRVAESVLFADGAYGRLYFIRSDGTLWRLGGEPDRTWQTSVPQKVLEDVRLP